MSIQSRACPVCGDAIPGDSLFYLPEHGLRLFLGTRCASTSVKKALIESLQPCSGSPHSDPWLLERRTENATGPGFVFVRHPYQRALSAWRLFARHTAFSHLACWGMARQASWPEFCAAIRQTPKENADLHLQPISHHLDGNDWIVCRQENLDTDWELVRAASLVPLGQLEVEHESASESLSEEDYQAGIAILGDYYDEDFARFGYEK